ncbi:MAG: GDSL-type esterase/lipase family protein [Saprospiraceae bacterium]
MRRSGLIVSGFLLISGHWIEAEPLRVLLGGGHWYEGTAMTNPAANALTVQLQALSGSRFAIESGSSGSSVGKEKNPFSVIYYFADWMAELQGVSLDTLSWRTRLRGDLGRLLNISAHARIVLVYPPRVKDTTLQDLDDRWEKAQRPYLERMALQNDWETIDLELIFITHPEFFQDGVNMSSIAAGAIARRIYTSLLQDRVMSVHLPVIDQLSPETFTYHGYQGYKGNLSGRAWRVIFPRHAQPGHPWIWRMLFWGHEPQTEIALLERGWYVVYCDAAEWYGNDQNMALWDQFYDFLRKAGMAESGVLEGFSRGGMYAYRWALHRPESVAGIYADAPVLDMKSWPGGRGASPGSARDWEIFRNDFSLTDEASADQFRGNPLDLVDRIVALNKPLLHVVGDADQVVPVDENTNLFATRIRALGGTIRVIHKPGVDHHPHSLPDPTPIVDFVQRCVGRKINWANLSAPGNEYRSAAGWSPGMEWHSLFTEMNGLRSGFDSVDLLLFGNSITQSIGGPGRSVAYRPGEPAFTEAFAGCRWYNFGISGDRTQHVRWRIREGNWQTLHPKVVVITIGVNNIPWDDGAEIFTGILGIVEDIRAKDTAVRVLVVGPLPTKNPASENRLIFENIHHRLAEYPFPAGVRYTPLAFQLLDSAGQLPGTRFSSDGIHLLPEGYAAYAKLLKEELEQYGWLTID